MGGIQTVVSAADEIKRFSAKTIIAIIGLVIVLSATYIYAQPLLDIPKNQAHHDSTTKELIAATNQMAYTAQRQLCIQVADHRKMDWQLCYTDPAQVIPQPIRLNGSY